MTEQSQQQGQPEDETPAADEGRQNPNLDGTAAEVDGDDNTAADEQAE